MHGFTDIQTFRVRLSRPLHPYRGRDTISAYELADLPSDTTGWLDINDLAEIFPARFSSKNRLNIPGPIYGADTDTCCSGPEEAPHNVLLDRNGQEFVFKQASTASEFRDLLCAARAECFQGYGADGDSNWRLSTIRDWWRNREEMLREEIFADYCNAESIASWKRALQGEAVGYLQVYAFFIENGRVPNDADRLPEMS